MHLSRKVLESLLEKPRLSPGGNDLYAICPYCGKDEFGISLKKNHKFNCFRKKHCGEPGSIFKLLKHLGREDLLENIHQIDLSKGLDFDLVDEFVNDEVLEPIEVPRLYRRLYKDSYLESRGLTKEDFEKYNIGYEINRKDFVIFLVYHNKEVVGLVKRCKSKKIYLNLGNLSYTFFGVDDLSDSVDTVILVEGIFDKLSIDRSLLLNNNENVKCLATFGAKLSDSQIRILKENSIKNLYFMFEADVLKKVKSASMKVDSLFEKVRVAYLPSEDPDDMTRAQVIDKLNNSKPPFNFYYDYI